MNIFPQKMIFGNFTQRIRTMKTDLGNITNVTKKLRAEREERKRREGREETEGERTEIEGGEVTGPGNRREISGKGTRNCTESINNALDRRIRLVL